MLVASIAGMPVPRKTRCVVNSTAAAVKTGTPTKPIWWCATRPGRNTECVITAPSNHQVEDILWEELGRRLDELEKRDPDLRWSLCGVLPKVPHRGLRFHNGAKIIGKSTDKPEKAAGLSAANLLIIIDEASGYADELWEAMEGNLAGDAKIFAISNPTKPVGWFARLWRTKEGKGWKLFTISSEETPNVKSGKRRIPGLAGLAWIKRLREKLGSNGNSIETVRGVGYRFLEGTVE